MDPIKNWPKKDLVEELLHFQEVASLILPRKANLPRLPGIDYFAATEPYKGCVCGDHLIILNFDEYNIRDKIRIAQESGNEALTARLSKNLDSFGILIADAAGHMITDNTTANYLHAAFKTGVGYELKFKGEVTSELFEVLNTTFYNRMSPDFLRKKPYVTLIYGEVHNDGRFRFLSAGHPPPIVFSNEYDRIERLGDERTAASTPLGIFPSEYSVDIENFEPTIATKGRYHVNELRLLGDGDIMILYTDGLTEQQGGALNYCEARLEAVLREVKRESARDIYGAIRRELDVFCPPDDDLTIAVIKKKRTS